MKPGGVEMFEVAIPAATLTSPREGLDANMYKALMVTEHPDIIFRLLRFEPAARWRAEGNWQPEDRWCCARSRARHHDGADKGTALTVRGHVALLMTDFGIKPPVAMMGMLKTDPKVTVTFETVLGVPLT